MTGIGCVAGTPPKCDDGVACTVDACDDLAKACLHAPVHAICEDGSFCNGVESCMPSLGCVPGAVVTCDDGVACTADSCDDAGKTCVYLPVDAACQDGTYCNGVERCAPGESTSPSGCAPGMAVTCASDGVGCTTDACDEGAKSCTHVIVTAACASDEACVPLAGGCVPGKPCATDAECDDGDLCNGVEVCDPAWKICRNGAPKVCKDGLACTSDGCNKSTGACTYTPHDALCDDGFACNGGERCDAEKGCVAGVAPSCDDGLTCTLDSCSEPDGTCGHLPNHLVCDDGLFCNGVELCDSNLGCVAGSPPTCDDGVGCTVDACDPLTDTCAPVPDDSLCACLETCDAVLGCGNRCVPATCQGKTYACGNCLDDDGDCRVDSVDAMCLGPCDNSEAGLDVAIPGANNAPCKQDCYFDSDTGAGNDGCYSSHSCDPLEVAPSFDPEGPKCSYAPASKIPGTNLSCSTTQVGQAALCTSYCAPLTPNGCDCFGCCLVPGATRAIWLGSMVDKGNPTCTLDVLDDPSRCHSCTQVPSCLNTYETCELCLGKDTLPPECGCQVCPVGAALCGGPCPFGEFCLSGCCVPVP
jgi:hypothetical protein